MTNNQTEILIFIGVILITLLFLKTLFKLVDQLTDYFINKITSEQKWIENAPFSKIIQESIYFTKSILFNKEIKHFPKFQISYYYHNRFHGQYNNDVITIFKKKNKTISDAVEITLHEVAHYIQDHTDIRYKKYETYNAEVGYDNNPLEVEARKFASRHVDKCLLYLEAKSLVKRV